MSSTAVLALLAGAGLLAQQASAPAPAAQADQPQRPTFRAQIDYVEVSAIVTDDDGNLVSDLKQGDFQVFENGKPQTISVFTPVRIPFETPTRTLIEGRPLKFDVATNEGAREGRVYVIVLDDYHIGALRANQVKRAAKEFIEKHVAANDMVAVIHSSGRNNASQEFTSDKDLMTAAIDKLMGMKLRSATLERLDDYRNRVEYQNALAASSGDANAARDRALDMLDPERAFNARSTMETLRNVSRLLETVNGSRKAVLFYSEGIDYNIIDIMGTQTGSRFSSDVLYSMRDAIGAATRSNVAYYTIDPRGLTAMSDDEMDMQAPPQDVTLGLNPWNIRDEQRLAQMSLMSLAEETGGAYSVNSNDFTKIYERVVRDSSNYYLLGYYPTDERRNGAVRRIEVKVNRKDVKVYARKAYQAPKDKEEKKVTESAAGTSPEVRFALNSALPTPGLNLSVHAAPFKGANKTSSVAITVQVEGEKLAFKQAGDVFTNNLEISMMAMDIMGKVPDGDRANLDLKLRKETRDRMAQTGIRSVATLDLPPGRYQLRVAAREANNGTLGSVFTDLIVPDFSDKDLSMSGILLTSTGAQLTPTPRMEESLKKLMPLPPTTTRGFAQVENLFGYVDVYDSIQGGHSVDITTTVTRVDGTKVFNTTEERKSTELGGGKGGGYGVQFEVPLKDFAPGLYVLKVEAKPRLDKPSVSREVTFAVYGPPGTGTEAASNAPRFVPIAHGPLSNGGGAAREAVVRTEQDWAALWAQLPTKQAAPQVAFDQMMVVGVFLGNRPTSGYKVEIAGVGKDGDTLIVMYREIPPVQGSSVTATVTTPFAVAGVTRHDGPVRFEKVADK
ncbi:VWA domain-containing protein [Luteitalea sp. TBR-22]|uniref:VWA domain-containing protein n=1 Tax=Luteitalea sp. TBR-22 TaxID=2802971 RepID=UPI001EF7401F|nr:VWA domain-containing protein [Luteitalea sp. TBR-22]